jgi:hypothetical protein
VPRNASSRPARAAKSGPSTSFRVDADLKAFLESGVAVLVGTGDEERRPCVVYGWAPRVHEDGTKIDVFVDTVRSDQTVTNARANGRIALTVADPVSYRSVQVKGTLCEICKADARDRAWVQRHHEAFIVSTSLVGDPPGTIANLWTDDVTRLTFAAERAFDQTPGPDAGKPL